jgi:mRNA interferase RelE/StbE
MFELVFTDKAKRQYSKLDNRVQRQVDKGLQRLVANPQVGKPLRGRLKGIWSERVATYRILYKIKEKEVEILVLVIEHRKSVYRGK